MKKYLLIESDSISKEDIWIYNPNIFDLCRKFNWETT